MDGTAPDQLVDARTPEAAVRELEGLKLSIAREAADMRIFHFGDIRPSRKGPGTTGSHALHIQCCWRLLGPQGIITGYSDRFTAADQEAGVEDTDALRGNLQRMKLLEFLGQADETTRSAVDDTSKYIVTSARLGPYCTLEIGFQGGETLHVIPDGSRMEDWRLIAIDHPDPRHLVVEGGKAEFQ